jgi:hypothetical protein
MRRLIIAGLIYLTGIAIILLAKPSLMFQEDGRWKEFGIGRDPAYFTYVPFWLFTIIWSILSYIIVLIVEESLYAGPSSANTGSLGPLPRNTIRNRTMKSNSPELTPGYYVLNEGATGRNGVPRYVYLGPEIPEN